MSLSSVVTVLSGEYATKMSMDAWRGEQDVLAEKVALLRDYADGDHRSNLTNEMRKLLRLPTTGSFTELNANYMPLVINAEADRLLVSGFDCDTEAAMDWIDGVLYANRFDGIQGDVHSSTLRDGDAYVLVDWDNEGGAVRLTPEPAFDGALGILCIHDDLRSSVPSVAVRVWSVTTESIGDTVRINVFYPDRIEKYISRQGAPAERYEEEGEAWPAPWVLPGGEPIGVPIIHFRNRGAIYNAYGQSEIEDAIPLQDSLNRVLYSMVMASELTAFQVRYAIGFQPPAGLTPGMWVTVGGDGMAADQRAELGVMPQGEIVPFIEQARYLVGEIGRVTATPLPEFMGGDAASGEALKQRESSLLGKIRRAQYSLGNSWEDTIKTAHRVQQAFGSITPPPIESIRTQWEDAEVRNDKVVIENAMLVADKVGDLEFLRMIAPVFDWDEARVQSIYDDKLTRERERMDAMAGVVTPFGAYSQVLQGVAARGVAPVGVGGSNGQES